MKHVYMTNGVGGRCLAFFTAFFLCACSVLQVDVDEYKGALSNHEDIQLQQYAALATSAKPIIVALRNNYILDDDSYDSDKNSNRKDKEADRNCLTGKDHRDDMDDYIGCTFKLNIAYFLNSILALYEDTDDLNKKIKAACKNKKCDNKEPSEEVASPSSRQQKKGLPAEDDARDDVGITKLTKNFIEATEKANERQDESTLNKLRIAKERLNNALIIFAEKILYTVNNHQLANGSMGKESYARKLAVLQSLGNTLVVHADDLRKRAAHNQRLEDRKDSELAAAQQAFAPGAQNSFDNLVGDLEVSVRQKGSRELILASAISEFDKRPVKTEDIDRLKTTLETAAQKVQPTLNAYRTAFGDYNFGIGGVIPAEDSAADEDRRDIAGLFKKDDPKVTDPKKVEMDVVFTTLKSWFNESNFNKSKIDPVGKLLPSDPKYNRRNCAETAFDNFKKTLSQQDLKVVGTEAELFKKLGDRFLAELDEDKLNLKKTQKEIADKEQALAENKKNIEEKDRVAGDKGQLEKTLTTVKSIKQAVLQQAEIAKVVDLSGLRHLLLLEIENQSKSATEPTKEELRAAHDMLAAMSIPKSLQFVGGSHVKTQRDVLDDVIAQLQQQRLEAASRGADITALNKALELAYEQRGGLAYLRPASAYLRNAFANTSIQDNSGSTNCRNLLFPLFCNENGNLAFRDTKAEIDKQFWQTINTIKVRGGGATDFAIVKDDVGNWYVKGLSSDPESIIKSAQSLALFNMGGKVNLDLLGQVETRRELAKLKIDDPNRQVLKDELKAKQSGSGANTAGLEKVLAKYRKEYLDATTMNVDGLIGKLDQLPIDITAAWQGINFDETPKASFGKLTALLGTPAELVVAKKLLEDAKAVLAQGNALAAGTAKAAASEKANISASDAIVKSLVEVRNMRSRLVKAIIQNDEFIAAQRQAYDEAKIKIDAETTAVDEKKKEWEGADTKVTKAQALLDGTNATVDKQKIELEKAKQGLITAQKELDKVQSALAKEVSNQRSILDVAETHKSSVQARVTAAGAKVTPAEQAELTEAEKKLKEEVQKLAVMLIQSADVNAKTNARDAAQVIQEKQQKILDEFIASADVKNASSNLKVATDERSTAKEKLDEANNDLVKARTAAKGAENAYTLAKSNRLAAARKVTMSANSLIETTAANRLEAVKAYEVAIGFVGQTAGGQ